MGCPDCAGYCDDCHIRLPLDMLYPTDDGKLICHICLSRREDEEERNRLNTYFEGREAG